MIKIKAVDKYLGYVHIGLEKEKYKVSDIPLLWNLNENITNVIGSFILKM